ncbi:glycosyltransferase family 2 protein [Piscinibacter sp. XHJ-5]|uniref:glycosyltransferase family 2 protein n=1 Tax=Piscinibacter sp. XHJ-5 TaxID=3037797 RepID=UPI00245305C4|nr:glycosyltransferase family 2 protein [Piscinibacter sp. XHJ-5]
MSADPTYATAAPPSHRPLVSVGMPTYNAEQTIAASIECLLQQTVADFELLVSDNASTDGTWDVIQDIARRDARVIGIRQPKNIGANGNYSAVFRRARGGYFKWASSNDWCAPQFLEHCVARLEAHPDTVLVAPRTRLFQGDLNHYTDYDRDIAFDQPDPVDRFIAVSSKLPLNNILNGVMRTAALARTRLIEHYVGADVVLVGHLALLGKIELLDEPMFYRRMDRETATQMMSAEALHRHHYPVKTRRALFPAWRKTGGWLHAALASDLSRRDTLRAVQWSLRQAYWKAPELGRDVVDAIGQSVRR